MQRKAFKPTVRTWRSGVTRTAVDVHFTRHGDLFAIASVRHVTLVLICSFVQNSSDERRYSRG